jgi:hypothetical protein
VGKQTETKNKEKPVCCKTTICRKMTGNGSLRDKKNNWSLIVKPTETMQNKSCFSDEYCFQLFNPFLFFRGLSCPCCIQTSLSLNFRKQYLDFLTTVFLYLVVTLAF